MKPQESVVTNLEKSCFARTEYTPLDPLAIISVSGVSVKTKLFLREIRKFNSSKKKRNAKTKRHLLSSRKSSINNGGRNFQTTLKIRVQAHLQIGSLLPVP